MIPNNNKNLSTLSLLLAALIGLAGCAGPDGSAQAPERQATEAADIRVVVAVVDTSINLYHDFYYAGSPIYADSAPASVTPAVLAELGIPQENHLRLTRSGDFAADVQADAATWDLSLIHI